LHRGAAYASLPEVASAGRALDRIAYRLPQLDRPEGAPTSAAVRAGDLVFVSGCHGLDRFGDHGDARTQTRRALDAVRALVEQAGGTMADVVDVVSYHRDPRDIEDALDAARASFSGGFPAWTAAGTTGLADPGAQVCIQAIACLGDEPKECFTPDSLAWWKAYPASGGCRKGGLLFVAGQSATDPGGNVLEAGDHVAQSRHAYAHMLEVVEAAGGTVADILDFSSFHHDIRGAEPTLLDVYVPTFMAGATSDTAATTSHIGATGLLRPGMLGVYRALADLDGGARVASTPDSIWWNGVYPIAGAARKERGLLITIAGQVACAPDASIVAPGDPAGQARYVFACMEEALVGVGASMADVALVTAFAKDPRSFNAILNVAGDHFPTDAEPAWTLVGTPGLWMEGYLLEIGGLAVVPAGGSA
jgi:enamine deaminase RidA (YjgF/YER057c/UK114 family)